MNTNPELNEMHNSNAIARTTTLKMPKVKTKEKQLHISKKNSDIKKSEVIFWPSRYNRLEKNLW